MAITGPAKFKEYQRVGDSTYRIRVEITDPARTPPTFEKWLTVEGTTQAALLSDVSRQIAALKGHDATKDVLAGITVDSNIPTDYTPPPPPAPTPDMVWVSNKRALLASLDLKTALGPGRTPPQLTTDIDALADAVSAGYTTDRGKNPNR